MAVILVLPTLAAALTTWRRRPARLARLAVPEEQEVRGPTPPDWTAEELLASSVCVVLDVVVTDVVAVDDDLVVAFAGGPGSWYQRGDLRLEGSALVRPVSWVESTIPLHVPLPLARRRAMNTLTQWRTTCAELQAFMSVQFGLVGLVNPATGAVFASPLNAEVIGRV